MSGRFYEFNQCHEPAGSPVGGRFAQRGRCGDTTVGITSARPEKGGRAVFDDMRGFEASLKAVKGVTNVKVSPGLGAWEGGSEPTWVVSYRGNGEARRLLARTGKQFNQDGVLLMKPCRGRGCDPAVELHFDRGVGGAARDAVHGILKTHGMGGWTWYKSGGQTVLRMVSVPAWGGDRAAHLAASRDISASLARAGLTHKARLRGVRAEVLTRENYDTVIGGQS